MALLLLDTDAVIDFSRNFPPAVQLIESLFDRGDVLCTCAPVVTEACSGLFLVDEQRTADFLAALTYLAVTREAAEQAGRWRFEFRRKGVQLGTPDMMIAATAYSHGATIVTGNLRHFPMPEVALLPLPR